MECKVNLLEHALEDLKSLTKELQEECIKMLEKLENNINLGQSLENKNGRDLSGYYKIYFNDYKYRIIYKKVKGTCEIEGILRIDNFAEVWGVGLREGEEIYKIVAERISDIE